MRDDSVQNINTRLTPDIQPAFTPVMDHAENITESINNTTNEQSLTPDRLIPNPVFYAPPPLVRIPDKEKEDNNRSNTITNLRSGRANSSIAYSVFQYWASVMGKENAVFDAKREQLINARLAAGYTPETLCEAINGCAASEWHQGKNKEGKMFNNLELILRDSAHVEQFVEIARNQVPMAAEDPWGCLTEDAHVIKGECNHG